MPLGSAVETGAGKLPFKAIIHVAGINMFWTATESSIRDSVRNAMTIVNERRHESVAFPVIGAGSGRFNVERARELMLDAFKGIDTEARVVIVTFKKS